jgi:hypothetical protein
VGRRGRFRLTQCDGLGPAATRIFDGSLLITASPTLCVLPRDTEMRALVPRSEPVSARPISMQCYYIIPCGGRS